MSTIVLTQLYALRAQIEATILTLEHEMGAGPQQDSDETSGDPETCTHPAAKQQDASTLGTGRVILCTVCGTERPGVAES